MSEKVKDTDQPEPTLSDIVKFLSAIDKKLDKKVDSVKADLTKVIGDQADIFEASLKRGIDEAVGPISKRQDEFEEKSEERDNKLKQL